MAWLGLACLHQTMSLILCIYKYIYTGIFNDEHTHTHTRTHGLVMGIDLI